MNYEGIPEHQLTPDDPKPRKPVFCERCNCEIDEGEEYEYESMTVCEFCLDHFEDAINANGWLRIEADDWTHVRIFRGWGNYRAVQFGLLHHDGDKMEKVSEPIIEKRSTDSMGGYEWDAIELAQHKEALLSMLDDLGSGF